MHTLLQSLTIWVTILLILCCILLSHCYWRGHNWTLLHLHYHQCWIERKHPFSWSGWLHSWLDFSAARTCYWLTFNLLSSQIPRCLKICFLYSQSTSRTFGRDYLILDAGFCISLHWTLWGACLFFHSVKVPVKTSPEIQHMDSLSEFGAVCKLWCHLMLNCERICSTTAQKAIELLRMKLSLVNMYWLCSFNLLTNIKMSSAAVFLSLITNRAKRCKINKINNEKKSMFQCMYL